MNNTYTHLMHIISIKVARTENGNQQKKLNASVNTNQDRLEICAIVRIGVILWQY